MIGAIIDQRDKARRAGIIRARKIAPGGLEC